ncbi:IS30 family transposase [Flammeovirga pectinis]|uniref:IS30 family transposase n=1 Tax=Flammeovirga pectinis TaxID=2494373 RepID=A0A3S9NXK2_9BACT|nr:IS30 family transposase [Flammeovirga pectinis]AZQ60690.1 IS30 family transposase [Flammeovirga pectinis]
MDLTLSQRYKIETYLEEGYSNSLISDKINVHKSTVGRELKRCDHLDGYDAVYAHKRYLKKKCKQTGFHSSTIEYKDEILSALEVNQYSPEQIVNRKRLEGGSFPCVETVYQIIYSQMSQNPSLKEHLRHHKKKRRPRASKETRGKLTNRKNIRTRPIEADNRSEIGHWEADVVIGTKARSAVLVTLVDRKSGYLLVGKANSKSENDVGATLLSMYERTPIPWYTITFDNGKEFACHQKIEELCNTVAYFADPYSSWQRGTNENTNGLLRQYFPKGQSMEDVLLKYISKIENKLNNRPRKRYGFYSPIELINNIDINAA